jgi:putative lipase involved disintegration of autophagic bodies
MPAICDGCQVHKGFYEAYMSIRDGVVQTVRDLRGAYPAAPIVVTGHSLGGALVELASVDFELNEGIMVDTSVGIRGHDYCGRRSGPVLTI